MIIWFQVSDIVSWFKGHLYDLARSYVNFFRMVIVGSFRSNRSFVLATRIMTAELRWLDGSHRDWQVNFWVTIYFPTRDDDRGPFLGEPDRIREFF